MFVLLVATMVILSLLAMVGVVALVVVGLGGSKKRKARRRALLTDGLNRLKTVVAALLARLNDLDQQFQYQQSKPDSNSLKARIEVVASDLVKVTDTLPAIEQLISEDRFDEAADLLSAACRLIDKVVRMITQMESSIRWTASKEPGVAIDIGKRSTVRSNKKAE
jgi:hypothetical protein